MCMKRSFLLILSILLVCLTGASKRVSEQEAYEMALKFIQGKSIKANQRMVKGAKGSPALKNIYVFNVENNGGFVIVSGDDRTRSILGYSDSGELNTERIPCNMQWLLDNYEKQIASLTDDTSIIENTRSEDRQDIPALIDVQWGQDEPYNNNCPTLNGERCLTGCVATAMAQLIQYHSWPQETTLSIPAYTSNSGIYLEELPPAVFNWERMDVVSIPQLMRYCGQSVRMDYTPWASGADINEVPKALKDYFNFSLNTSLKSRSNYTDTEWNELIYNELNEGRPVLYSGDSSTAGAHTFMVDGYVGGLFHVNWGWEGNCDGFFTLEALNPGTEYGFTNGQTALINVYPADPDEEKILPRVKITKMDCNERLVFRNSLMDDFPLCSFEVVYENITGRELNMEIGLTLYKDSEDYCMLTTISNCFLYPYAGGGTECGICISSDLPEGTYKVIPAYRFDSSDKWIPLADSDKVYLEITVTEKELSIQPYPKPSFENDIVDYGMYMINNIRYRLRAEYGKYLAYPQPLNGNETYEGELYIPDFVTYDGIDYKVSNKSGFSNGMLDNNALLKSLSTPIAFHINNALGLKTIHFREGVTVVPFISSCPQLESIIIDSASEIPEINDCNMLKSITIGNDQEIMLHVSANGIIWSQEECPALSDIYFTSNVPPVFIYDNVKFESVPCEHITIHVPYGTKDVFVKQGWSGWNIVDDQPALPNKVIWDYCGNDVNSTGAGIGYFDRANDVEFAMKIPAQYLESYRNCKVTAIEYNAYDADDVEYVFLTMPGRDYYARQSAKTIGAGKMRVNLDNPYIIADEDLYVGIGRHGYIDISWANSDIEENGLWYRVMGDNKDDDDIGKWGMVTAADNLSHPVPIHMIIEGDNLPDDIMILDASLVRPEENIYSPSLKPSVNTEIQKKILGVNDKDFVHFRIDGERKLPKVNEYIYNESFTRSNAETDKTGILLKIRNRSPRIVRNVMIDWKLDGKEMDPLQFNTVFPQNYNELIYFDLPEEMPGRNHSLEFDVAEIDGKPDTVTCNNTKTSTFSMQSSLYFPRKFVLEEATGTWCGYCPSGLATIEKMKERYPDNFIAIAIHSDSEMSIADGSYDSFLDMVSSFPSARLNRIKWLDMMNPFDLDSELEMGVAMIKASASFTEGKCVDVKTETTFGFDEFGQDSFRIAYVVTEDKVGPYLQNNNYSNQDSADDPEEFLNWWIHQNQIVPYIYNDVVRIIEDYEGILGLFHENIEEGKTYSVSYRIPLPEKFNNHENLNIVTLLLDSVTGEILNADSTEIEGEYTSVSENIALDNVRIRVVERVLIIENAVGSNITISNIEGLVVKSFKASLDSERVILNSGIYIINIGGNFFKVIVR